MSGFSPALAPGPGPDEHHVQTYTLLQRDVDRIAADLAAARAALDRYDQMLDAFAAYWTPGKPDDVVVAMLSDLRKRRAELRRALDGGDHS